MVESMGNKGIRRSIVVAVGVGVLALTACVGGAPSAESIAGEFGAAIEPAWEADIPHIFGEPMVRHGVVLAYSIDEADGMLLSAFSLDTGEQLWQHVASPGGAYSNPILAGVDSASRPYPLPTITPLVVETGEGEDTVPAVVYFQRDVEGQSMVPDDLLKVVDLTTGEPLDVSTPDVDPEEFTFEPLGVHDDGEIFANTYSPAYRCGQTTLCWVSTDAELFDGSGSIQLDTVTLEARYAGGLVPEPADGEEVSGIEWGYEYARISGDGIAVARFSDGEEVWRADVGDLFGVERTSPPDYVDFVQVGDLVLIQGYQPIRETLEIGKPHTLSLDFTESRTLVAVNVDSGEVAWRLPGGDMLCHAVHERTIADDATTIPVCLASGGSFIFNLGTEEMVEEVNPVASIAEIDVATGEVGWETDGAGVASIAHTGRLVDVTYAARGNIAVVDIADDEATGLIDLTDGVFTPVTVENASYVCKAERDDVLPKFEGSAFSGGTNPITTGYPAGWYHFPCDDEGAETEGWSKGAVRLAGYPAVDSNRVVLPLEGSLVAFDLG